MASRRAGPPTRAPRLTGPPPSWGSRRTPGWGTSSRPSSPARTAWTCRRKPPPRERAAADELERAERADHAADPDGALLRVGAARRRWHLAAVADRRLGAVRGRDDHRQGRR